MGDSSIHCKGWQKVIEDMLSWRFVSQYIFLIRPRAINLKKFGNPSAKVFGLSKYEFQ